MENDKSPRVIRGGSWSDTARCVRVAVRYWLALTVRSYTLGFRFFHFVSDLELLAGPTRELSDGK